MAIPELQRNPLKLCSIIYERFLRSNGETRINKDFSTVSSTFLIRLRFQGYRCKSGIVIFAHRESIINTLTVRLIIISNLKFVAENILFYNSPQKLCEAPKVNSLKKAPKLNFIEKNTG